MKGYMDKRTTAEFTEWIRQQQYRIAHVPQYVVLYKAGNTLIRRIRLHNGEIIETYIEDTNNGI